MSTVLQPASQLPQPLLTDPARKERGDGVVKFGVVGYGYWGPNVVRNLDQFDGSEVVTVCDKSPAARKRDSQNLSRTSESSRKRLTWCHQLRSTRLPS